MHSLQHCAVKKKNIETHSIGYRTPYNTLRARLRARQLWQSGLALTSTASRDEMVQIVREVAA